jgi:hypothetical protein
MFLERPIQTASAANRTWYGYSPYLPRNAEKMLDMFRVYYNYCPGRPKKRTPAMRIGLASKPVPLDELLGLR